MGKAEDYLREQKVRQAEEAARRHAELEATRLQSEEREQRHAIQLKALLDAVIPHLFEALESKQWPDAELVQFCTTRRGQTRFWRKKRMATGEEVACWHVGYDDDGNDLFLLSTGQLGLRDLWCAWYGDSSTYTKLNLMVVLSALSELEVARLQTSFIQRAVIECEGELDDILRKELIRKLRLDLEEVP